MPRTSFTEPQQTRSVNELLADLRRGQPGSARQQEQVQEAALAVAQIAAPSVPPSIRHILQLPETPPPRPRRPARVDPLTGRRLPPGPAAPRSWLSGSGSLALSGDAADMAARKRRGEIRWTRLAGLYTPEEGSLVDIMLRKIARDWEFQASYNRYFLYSLPSRLRGALMVYLGQYYHAGVALPSLQALLLPPPDGGLPEAQPLPGPSTVNEDLLQLDLTGALGRMTGLREVSELLFPSKSKAAPNGDGAEQLQDSWDAPEAPSVPRPLLPNLTHLSLAIYPESASTVSWKQLLAFAAHLPRLTHLSLAYWPEPSLVRNAKFATVARPLGGGAIDYGRFGPLRHALQRDTFQYGGTGPYSHSLDGDWSEAVLVLRKLSKSLYGLEYLDLTGCSAWVRALVERVDHDTIDWAGDWGKVTTLVLHNGYRLPDQAGLAEKERYRKGIDLAKRIESYITARRAGQGRWITVQSDKYPET